MYDILCTDGRVLFSSETASSGREAVEHALEQGVCLKNANLSGLDLHGLDLSKMPDGSPRSWLHTRFDRCDLARATFDFCELGYTSFSNANISEASFRSVNPGKSNFETPFTCWFTGAEANGAIFHDAHLAGSFFDRANLCYSSFAGARVRDSSFNYASLRTADLTDCDFTNATFFHASLYNTDLRNACLSGAELCFTDLSEASGLDTANLFRASVSHVRVSRGSGLHPARVDPLVMLWDQPGEIIAYKLVTRELEGPFYGGLRFEPGTVVSVPRADSRDSESCAEGINVATLPWCCSEWEPRYRIVRVSFRAEDIAAIPAGDGKFRLYRCRVLDFVDLDVLGLTNVSDVRDGC